MTTIMKQEGVKEILLIIIISICLTTYNHYQSTHLKQAAIICNNSFNIAHGSLDQYIQTHHLTKVQFNEIYTSCIDQHR